MARKKEVIPLTESQQQLVTQNLGLVYTMLGQIKRRWPNLNEEDCIGAGYVGLTKAAAGFNPEFKVLFSTYACAAIKQTIYREIREGRLIRVPYRSNRAREETITRQQDALRASFVPLAMTGTKEDYAVLALPEEEKPCPVEEADSTEYLQRVLRTAMRHLTRREKEVTRLVVVEGKTLRAVGEILGITKERVRQIRLKAIVKLRRQLRVTA